MNKKHKRTKTILKVLGIIFLLIGLSLMIWGATDFIMKFSTESKEMPKIWLMGIGIPFIFIGSVCSMFGWRKEVMNYVKNDSMPTIKDAYKDLQPELRDFAKTVTQTPTGEDKIMCINCGVWNDPEAKFCKGCGKQLTKRKCPNCGHDVDADSRFCTNCGHKM